jgi:SulP family sulfate permease
MTTGAALSTGVKAPGAAIVQEGSGGIAFFVLTAGQASVTHTSPDGKQEELRTIGPGGVFGEMALFSNRPRSATGFLCEFRAGRCF